MDNLEFGKLLGKQLAGSFTLEYLDMLIESDEINLNALKICQDEVARYISNLIPLISEIDEMEEEGVEKDFLDHWVEKVRLTTEKVYLYNQKFNIKIRIELKDLDIKFYEFTELCNIHFDYFIFKSCNFAGDFSKVTWKNSQLINVTFDNNSKYELSELSNAAYIENVTFVDDHAHNKELQKLYNEKNLKNEVSSHLNSIFSSAKIMSQSDQEEKEQSRKGLQQ